MAEFPKDNRYTHNESRYQRPVTKYRCGRSALWGKPCPLGPNLNGSCGGTVSCIPFRNGDRWECRRPGHAGGACKQGPLPDGRCCKTQPACAPVPASRVLRGRLAAAAGILMVAIIAITMWPGSGNDQSATNTLMMDPGPLSDAHSAFTSETGCQSCHVGHEKSGIQWLAQFSEPASIDQGCVSCHKFDGPTNTAHNKPLEAIEAMGGETISCQSCHNEHQGKWADLTDINDKQCSSCHEKQFSSLAQHVEFSDRFPHTQPGGVVFDHNKHFKFHFTDSKSADIAPQSCTSCHEVSNAGNRVSPGNFEKTCAACHQANITDAGKSEFVLLGLPKVKLKGKTLQDFEQCGADPEEKFKPAGKSKSTAFMNWMLGVEEKKKNDYPGALCAFLVDMQKKGPVAMFDRMEQQGLKPNEQMFNGLSAELINQISSSWKQNERYRAPKYKLPKDITARGWIVTKKGDLAYKPQDHADPVMKAWVEYAVDLSRLEKKDKLADKFIGSLLSDEKGAGACMKCHVQRTDQDGNLNLAWAVEPEQSANRFVFKHDKHLRIVGLENSGLSGENGGCAVCHQINADSDYADTVRLENSADYHSNFNSLKVETCAQCHTENRVRNDCVLCHQYHEDPGFQSGISKLLGEIDHE